MKIVDLGRLDTPLLLFGGAYSNLQASEALLEYAQTHGFQPHQVFCTGDLVAYCAQPVETVALWRAFGGPILAGNCEEQLAENAMDCGCGFESGTTCDLLSAGWFAHADRLVDQKVRAWMGTLPERICFQHHGKRYAVVHGAASAINRFMWPTFDDTTFDAEITQLIAQVGEIDCVIAGHTGMAFERSVGARRWINAGAIGLPPNDGGQSTEFITLTEGQVTRHRLSYDADEAALQMQRAGLVQGYHKTLLDGFWPSEDVLPMDMRRTSKA